MDLHADLLEHFPDLSRVGPGTYAVGGVIRDLVFRISPADADLVCRGSREAAEKFATEVGGRFVDLGRETFDTYRVVVHERIYDFTEITGSSIEEDVGRRDFTMNAIAVALDDGRIIDRFDGESDIRSRTLRMVAEQNLVDDPLRILKGIRTIAQFDLNLDGETASAFAARAELVPRAAAERIRSELSRALSAEHFLRAVAELRNAALDRILFEMTFGDELQSRLEKIPNGDHALVLAMMFLDDRDAAERFLVRWKWSEADRRDVLGAIDLVRLLQRSETDVRIAAHDAGESATLRASLLLKATGEKPVAASLRSVLSKPEHFAIKPLLNGNEIAELTGLAPGPDLGRIKRKLLEAQLRGEITSSDEARTFVRSDGS